MDSMRLLFRNLLNSFQKEAFLRFLQKTEELIQEKTKAIYNDNFYETSY